VEKKRGPQQSTGEEVLLKVSEGGTRDTGCCPANEEFLKRSIEKHKGPPERKKRPTFAKGPRALVKKSGERGGKTD